jgi:hypothetical protein
MSKHIRFFPGVLTVSALAFSFSVWAGAGSARVDAVRAGAAQYSTDGVTWNEVKKGVVLNPGATIKTDTLGVVDLYLGKNGPFVRVTPDTTLALTTLNVESGAGESIITTELGLRAGKIQGVVRKMSAASKYEVVTPVGVVGIRGAKYQVSARGEFSVLEGNGYVKYNAPGAPAPTDFQLRAGYTFEPTLNNNKGGLIESLPSINEEITLAAGQYGGVAGVEVAGKAGYAPEPTWVIENRPFEPPGQGSLFQPFVLPPVFNPTTPITPGAFEDNDEGGE